MTLRTHHSLGRGGFTRLDLGAVLTSVALLSGLVLTTAMNTRTGVESTRCLWNFKNQAAAWNAHSNDNPKLLNSLHGSYHQDLGTGGFAQLGVWASGWQDWSASRDNTNVAWLRSPSFVPYLSGSGVGSETDLLFRCPSDRYLSSSQRRGFTSQNVVGRVRSYSQSIYVGPGNVSSGPSSPEFRSVERLDQIVEPSRIMVFLEEHPDSINDPAFFASGSGQVSWIDRPASFHRRAANFAFTDGHAELHRWEDPTTSIPVQMGLFNGSSKRGSPDLAWVAQSCPRAE